MFHKGFLLLLVLTLSCASTTMLNSVPSGAKVYIDGSLVGKTPFAYTDTKIIGATTSIQMKKEGCEDWSGVLARSESFQIGPCIAGVFLVVPFLWVMGYNPAHTYELECGKRTSVLKDSGNFSPEAAGPGYDAAYACSR